MAIKGIAGETLRSYIQYLYPNNEPITGATFTTVDARKHIPFDRMVYEASAILLGKPIWSNNVNWRDANGTIV